MKRIRSWSPKHPGPLLLCLSCFLVVCFFNHHAAQAEENAGAPAPFNHAEQERKVFYHADKKADPRSVVEKDIDFPNPLNHAKVGQWTLHRMAGRTDIRSTITNIDADGTITITMERKEGDSYRPFDEMKVSGVEAAHPNKNLTFNPGHSVYDFLIEKGEAPVAGAVMPVTIVRYSTGETPDDMIQHTSILSEKVPISGEVLVEADILTYPPLELIAYGEAVINTHFTKKKQPCPPSNHPQK